VNNIRYLRYLETARIAYMAKIGLTLENNKLGLILGEVNVKYKFPLTFPDQILIGTRTLLDSLDEFSLWTEQVIVSQKYQRVAAVCMAKLVSYDYELLQKVPWNVETLELIKSFEKLENY
jgi:acyl-CoA thioester hydrolase